MSLTMKTSTGSILDTLGLASHTSTDTYLKLLGILASTTTTTTTSTTSILDSIPSSIGLSVSYFNLSSVSVLKTFFFNIPIFNTLQKRVTIKKKKKNTGCLEIILTNV